MSSSASLFPPQPAQPFSMAEYRAFLREYDRVLEHPDWERLWKMRATYRKRLPVYLLARCPFCAGRVWEPIDTYSLNGLGWRYAAWSGYGWMGQISPFAERPDNNRDALMTRPSYESDCPHIEIVCWCVNLNGLRPDDVYYEEIDIKSEVPFVMDIPMSDPGIALVLHAIPVGRFDDPEPRPHYTAYFMSYFARDKEAFARATRPWRESGEYVERMSQPITYDFDRYLAEGRLFWLDSSSPDLPLRGGPPQAFPYANTQGRRFWVKLSDRRLKSGGNTGFWKLVANLLVWWEERRQAGSSR